MPVSFKQAELFGGAITVNMPVNFADVSTIRQVPDHQEIYLATDGFSSLIVDLGERVTETATDEEALLYHFSDIVDEHDERRIWSVRKEGVQVPHLPSNTPILTLHATTWPPPPTPTHPRRRPNTPTSVTILLTLIRLEAQTTDMLITLNIPHMPPSPPPSLAAAGAGTDADASASADADDEGHQQQTRQQQQQQEQDTTTGVPGRSQGGEAVVVDEDAQSIIAEVWRTLEIHDWNLFGGG